MADDGEGCLKRWRCVQEQVQLRMQGHRRSHRMLERCVSPKMERVVAAEGHFAAQHCET